MGQTCGIQAAPSEDCLAVIARPHPSGRGRVAAARPGACRNRGRSVRVELVDGSNVPIASKSRWRTADLRRSIPPFTKGVRIIATLGSKPIASIRPVPGTIMRRRRCLVSHITARIATDARPPILLEQPEHDHAQPRSVAYVKPIAHRPTFGAEPESLHQAHGGPVGRGDGGFDAMDVQRFEAMLQQSPNRLLHQTLPPVRPREDEADFEPAIANVAMMVVHHPDRLPIRPQHDRPGRVVIGVSLKRAPDSLHASRAHGGLGSRRRLDEGKRRPKIGRAHPVRTNHGSACRNRSSI